MNAGLGRSVRLALAVGLAGAVAGCVSYKTGTVALGERSDQRAYQVKHLSLRNGQTTEADLFRALGKPDYTEDAEDGSYAMYSWEFMPYEKTIPDYLNAYPPEGGPVGVRRRVLLLKFDRDRVLEEHRRRRTRGEVLPSECLTQWRQELAAGATPREPGSRG